MQIINFTPMTAVLGGLLIGTSASLMLFLHGRVAGISGFISNLLTKPSADTAWRALFVIGLILGSWLGMHFKLGPQTLTVTSNTYLLAIGGFCVGFGALLGGGCTSGHGICGTARLSRRSLVATLLFMVVAIVVVGIQRHLI